MALGYKFSWSDIDVLKKNWKDIADKNNGDFKVNNVHSYANLNDPNLLRFEMRIPFSKGDIMFISSEFKPLKICYAFNHDISSEFLIYEGDFTDKIGKLFGAMDIEINDPDFDKKFIIKGNNEELIKKILSERLKRFLLGNDISNFKLEKTKEGSTLEINLALNELELTKINEVLELFKECILTVKE